MCCAAADLGANRLLDLVSCGAHELHISQGLMVTMKCTFRGAILISGAALASGALHPAAVTPAQTNHLWSFCGGSMC